MKTIEIEIQNLNFNPVNIQKKIKCKKIIICFSQFGSNICIFTIEICHNSKIH